MAEVDVDALRRILNTQIKVGATRDKVIALIEENATLRARVAELEGDRASWRRLCERYRRVEEAYKHWRATVAMVGGGRDNAERLARVDAAVAALGEEGSRRG